MSNFLLSDLSLPSTNLVAVKKSYQTTNRNGRVVSYPLLVPSQQQMGIVTTHSIVTQANVNSLPSNPLSSQQDIQFKIQHDLIETPKWLTIRYSISETGASNSVRLCPAAYIADRIELWSPQQMLYRMYGDNSFDKSCALLSSEQFEVVRKRANISKCYNSTSDNDIPASGSIIYTHEILFNPLELANVDLSFLRDDLILHIYTRAGGCVVSGSGTASLTDVKLIFTEMDSEWNAPNAVNPRNQLISKYLIGCQYLQSQVYDIQSQTLTQGQSAQISLQNFVGKCAFLQLKIRSVVSTSAPTSNQLVNCYDLGPNATLDITNASGKSLLCNGNPVTGDYFTFNEFNRHFPSMFNMYNRTYWIPFCESMGKAFAGMNTGYLEFKNGATNYLNIIPNSAVQTGEVHTITLSGTVASGQYCFSYRGAVTDQLAYNANTTSMNSALNALPFFINSGLSCACSAAATASFTVTITGQNLHLLDGEIVKVIPNNMATSAPAMVTATSARTTIGVRGFTTGSYSITIYAWMYASMVQNGKVLQLA